MIVSLLYHDVVAPGELSSSGFMGGDADVYKLETAEFERHLNEIEHQPGRGEVIVLDSACRELAPGVLLFTFDDGGVSAMTIASSLERRDWRGHFFITTDYIGKAGFLQKEQILELHQRGHMIGSHSCSHPLRISHCTQSELEQEWKQSVQILSEICGAKTQVASVPGGYYSRRVLESAVAAGIEVLFNSEPVAYAQHVNGCLVLGRYSIQQGVTATTAARIACGDWRPRLRQYLLWNSKRVAKKLGGGYYVALRKSLLRNAGSQR